MLVTPTPWTMTAHELLSQGPATTIMSAPPVVATSPLAQFAWTSSGDVTFQCSLQPAAATSTAYRACSSPM